MWIYRVLNGLSGFKRKNRQRIFALTLGPPAVEDPCRVSRKSEAAFLSSHVPVVRKRTDTRSDFLSLLFSTVGF